MLLCSTDSKLLFNTSEIYFFPFKNGCNISNERINQVFLTNYNEYCNH